MAEPSPPDERRMSDVEALMWNLEKDPHLMATMANVTVFDQLPDPERLRRRMIRASHLVPRLRRKVVPGLGPLAPPEWRDDQDFDIDYHVRRETLPKPGTDEQLYALASRLAHTPFDRTRPLWEFTIIDGLSGGRGAMLQKLHHTITDGEGGIRMSVQFIDLERDAPEPPPLPEPELAGEGESRNLLGSLVDSIDQGVRRQAGAARRTFDAAVDTAVHPGKLASLPGEAVGTVQSVVRQLTVDDRKSPLWTERSLSRHFDVLHVPFDDFKAKAKELGGSINDLFVTGAAGGAGAYHRHFGADVAELRMAMPVSTRTSSSGTGNAFTPTRLLVSTDPDPRVRLASIQANIKEIRSDQRSIGLYQSLAGMVNALPTPVLTRMARQQTETVDFTTSNVRAAPFDLYIAGALLLANYPMGPLGGTAFNLTTMSYRGNLDMGLNLDPVAIAEPDLLHRLLQESFDEILNLS